MLLVMDVGNTNTSLGVFEGERLALHWRLTTEKARTTDEYGVHARNLFAFAGLDFKAINAIAIVWVLVISVVFALPPNELVLWTMLLLGGLLALYWASSARRRFVGPAGLR